MWDNITEKNYQHANLSFPKCIFQHLKVKDLKKLNELKADKEGYKDSYNVYLTDLSQMSVRADDFKCIELDSVLCRIGKCITH